MINDLVLEDSLESMLTPEQYIHMQKPTKLLADLISLEPRIKIPSFNSFRNRNAKVSYGDVFFRVTKEHIFLPGTAIPTVDHELAHMVEMDDPKRWVMNDWGMNAVPFFNDTVNNKAFLAGLSRELRVRAIQSIISPKSVQYVGTNIKDHIYWGEQEWKKRIPFGKFTSINQVDEWCKHLHNQTMKHWSEEKIRNKWSIRLEYLQNYMETTGAPSALN